MTLRSFLVLTVTFSLLGAGGVFKRYPVRSGMIFYDINVSGVTPGKFTTQTHGIARLVFDRWGAREVKEEDSTEIQTGDYNETRDIHTMSKIDGGTVYTVDFEERNIYKTRNRDLDLAMAEGKDLSDENVRLIKEMKGIKVGTDTVAGFPCDVWQIKDQKICLYKGIPLKITIDGPGFHSERKAVSVVIDRPVPEDQFKLPDFPIIVDEEYTSNEAAKTNMDDYIASIEDLRKQLSKLGINPDDPNATLTPEQERAVIDTLGTRYLAKQKRLLPKLLVALKEAIPCIDSVSNSKEAKRCIDPVNKIDEELGDRTENFDFSKISDPDYKRAILEALTNEIRYLEVTNDCVQKHDKTSDVILCTEGNLGGDEGEQFPAR
ncbi:hypothetical protein [Nitratifractor sp.]